MKRGREDDSQAEGKQNEPLSYEARKKMYGVKGGASSSSAGAASSRDRKKERRREAAEAAEGMQSRSGAAAAAAAAPGTGTGTGPASRDDKYGPGSADAEANKDQEDQEEADLRVANFGLSGALTKDTKKGNMKYGVLLKYSEPVDAAMPPPPSEAGGVWSVFVFKGEECVEKHRLDTLSCYLVGKDEMVCDVLALHGSCSKQHAVLQFRQNRDYPSLMDLNSTNKTRLNSRVVDDARYYELRPKDVLRFGESTREYVLIREPAS